MKTFLTLELTLILALAPFSQGQTLAAPQTSTTPQTSTAPQTPATAAAPFDKTFDVAPSAKWVDTALDLKVGDLLEITATTSGTGANLCDPRGLPAANNSGKLPLDTALPGALIAKFQEKSDAVTFVGSIRNLRVSEAGRLYFGANLAGAASCDGQYSVKVHVTPGAGSDPASVQTKLASAAQIWLSGQLGGNKTQASQNPAMASDSAAGTAATGASSSATATAAKPLAVSRAALDERLVKDLQGLPRRVNDEFKNLGDMVNFVLIGSEKQVQDALAAADWHVADTSTPGAVVKAILMATQKQDYLQMPMSQLYLFGRVQDFGYEMAEPYAMVASRHHFRIWKSTLTCNGQTVWAGAGTHDIGFEKDQRNGKVTHKIDPMVDGERDHIGESLEEAGKIRMLNYFTPSDAIGDARNATGGGYQSDGRVLVMFLQ